ncbi:MAG: hypothetical protein V4537_04705 [Pseudomonadota bacterium]
MRVMLILAPALLLAACGGKDETADGTEISINGGDGNGFTAGMGKDGKIAIDAPGFKLNVDVPKIQLDAGDFDVNGVSLPTGSKITSMNIDGKSGDDAVRVAFTSPVGTAAVREWFQGKLAAKGVKLTAAGDNLSGTIDDGKAFSLTTKANGSGASESVLTVNK